MNSKTTITILIVALIITTGGLFYVLGTSQNSLMQQGQFSNRMKNNDTDQRDSQKMGGMMNQFSDNQPTQENCIAGECLNTEENKKEDLPKEVKDALAKAIDDEYKALTTYEAVMDKFGRQRPFTMIARSEEMHIAALKSIYDKYGVEIPKNEYKGNIEVPESTQQACQQGVDAEIENASLYQEELIPTVEGEYPDIERVFRNLMNASQSRHLPAFERCS